MNREGLAQWMLPPPLGVLHATWDARGLTHVGCSDAMPRSTREPGSTFPAAEGGPDVYPDALRAGAHDLEGRLGEALARYLAGEPEAFDLPLAPTGTPFQTRVWSTLRAVPYGTTISYAELARRVGSHPRAVGQAVGRNPLWILVPCHRVLGSDGSLTGYAGGLARKEALLRLEGVVLRPPR